MCDSACRKTPSEIRALARCDVDIAARALYGRERLIPARGLKTHRRCETTPSTESAMPLFPAAPSRARRAFQLFAAKLYWQEEHRV